MAEPFNQKLLEKFRGTQWLAPAISLGLGAAGQAWWLCALPAVWYWLTTNLKPPAEYAGKGALIGIAYLILYGIAFGICMLAWWVGTLLANMG